MTAQVSTAVEKTRQAVEVFLGRRIEFVNLEIRWRRDREFGLLHVDLEGSITGSDFLKKPLLAFIAIDQRTGRIAEPANLQIDDVGCSACWKYTTPPEQVGVVSGDNAEFWWVGTGRDDCREEAFSKHFLYA